MKMERMAMCLPDDGDPQFFDVPEQVVEEMSRRTRKSFELWKRATLAERAVGFLKRLSVDGGSIVSSAALTPDQVKLAWDENRIFVDQENLGYVLLPNPTESERRDGDE